MAVGDPKYAAKANDFFVVSVSVASRASAAAAGVGPFVGLFFRVSSSVTLISESGNSLILNDVARNTTLWIQGAYVSAIATATAVYGVI